MARITASDYKDSKLHNNLKDPAINTIIGVASRIVDRLVGVGLSDAVLRDTELYTALYLGVAEDRRIQSEHITPSTVSYERETYFQRLQMILGDKFALLGLANKDEAIKPAKVFVVSA